MGATWCGNAWCSLNSTQNAGNNDEWIASDGQRLLALAAAQPKPFFVAVGLHKPHTPYAYPTEIDALYPAAEKIALPTAAARRVPVGMPSVAWPPSRGCPTQLHAATWLRSSRQGRPGGKERHFCGLVL